jgi:hypothetical protein
MDHPNRVGSDRPAAGACLNGTSCACCRLTLHEIATGLLVSQHTLTFHAHVICRKVGVAPRGRRSERP